MLQNCRCFLKRVLCSVTEVQRSHLEDLEAGDIQYADEVLFLVLGFQCLVDTGHQPHEHFAVYGLGQGRHGVDDLSDTTNAHKCTTSLQRAIQNFTDLSESRVLSAPKITKWFTTFFTDGQTEEETGRTTDKRNRSTILSVVG